jgi:hypothetical protein
LRYLGVAKQRIADQIGSPATKGKERLNMLCAYLAGALLIGLLANAAFGAWWLDPIVGLMVAAVAVRERPRGLARRGLLVHNRRRWSHRAKSPGRTPAAPTPWTRLPTVSRRHLVAVAVGLLAGCGGSDAGPRAPLAESSASLRAQLKGATQSKVSDFPATAGRSLQAVADAIGVVGPQVGLASSVFTPGENRLAFGVIDEKTGFVYGKTAVYVADSPRSKAHGPIPAPADLLVTDPPYRSRTAAGENDAFAAVYEARVPFDRPGKKSILVVTHINEGLAVAPTTINVIATRRDAIPRPGERPPPIKTDTVASASGNITAIDTRLPPDDMHDVDFADVIGKKPVALLVATPALCQSRVCGPVVDIALQLKSSYRDRIEFIHQEVFNGNDPNKGLREPLRTFNLRTEPWLFVFDKRGRLTTRLEGSFGFNAVERALKSAL